MVGARGVVGNTEEGHEPGKHGEHQDDQPDHDDDDDNLSGDGVYDYLQRDCRG